MRDKDIKTKRKRQMGVASIVLVFALLLQTLSPVLALGEGLEDPRVVIITPLQENETYIYGDDKFITVTGEAKDSLPYPEITYFFDPFVPLDLPDGNYILSAHYHNLYGDVNEESMPNYFLTQKLNITEDTAANHEVPMSIEELGLLTLQSTANTGYIIPAISIYPEGQENAAIMYTQKAGDGVRKIRITPGTYEVIIALSDQTYTYFLEKKVTIAKNESITITVDDKFTSTLTMDKSSYDKGEHVHITQEIKDSYGNRLLGKVANLPIAYNREEEIEITWNSQAPTLKILNAENGEIYRLTSEEPNRTILDQWYGWQPYKETNLVEKLDTKTTFFEGEYLIPTEITGGIYTVKLDLGEGGYTHTQNPASFIIKGEVSAPVLDTILSPSNARELTITGTATPKTSISLYYTLDGGEKNLIDTTVALAETGRFSINFTPQEEGTYSFTAESFTAENSEPVSLVIDWTAPDRPVKLEGVSPDDRTIHLTWEPPLGETIAKYEVYRNQALIATVNVPYYTDSGLVNHTEYQYQVLAIDQASNKSDAAELTMFTQEVIQLQIESVNWKGSWDQQNHLHFGSSIDLTLKGTLEQSAKGVMAYLDQNDEVKTEERTLTENKNTDEGGTGIYEGSFLIPEGAKSIITLTGIIQEGENKVEVNAANLPAPMNAGLKVQLSTETLEKLGELKGAELSLWSKTKMCGGKTLITDAEEYVFSGLIPAEDYELQLMKGQKNLGLYQNISINGGLLTINEFDFNKVTGSLDVQIVDKENKPIYNALVSISSVKGDKVEVVASGDSGQDGWVRGWTDRGKTDRVPVVKDSLAGETLKITASARGSWSWEQYLSPVSTTMTLAPGKNEIIMKMPDRPLATLKGTVRVIDGNILANASITAYTKVGDFEIQRTTTSDKNGNYNLEVIAGKVRLVVTHRLAGSKEYTIENDLKGEEERDYPIYLPLEKRITLNIKAKNIGEVDYYYNQLIEPFVSVTLKNKRTEKISKVFGDWMAIPVPDAKPGDEIEISVDGTEAGYGQETLAVFLDEDSWAGAEVCLDEMGKIKATPVDSLGKSFTEQRVFAQIYRVDPVTGDLSYVGQNSSASVDLITDALPAGTYTIVFHTYPQSTVMTYERLLEYLEENAFVKENLIVTEGEIFDIGPVTVAKFEEHQGWYFFKGNEGNGFRANTNETVPGRLVTLSANFSYESEITRIRNDRFYITIPEGTEYVEDSLVVKMAEGSRKILSYVDKDKGHIGFSSTPTYEMPKLEGSVTYQVRVLDEPGRSNLAARFWVDFRSGDEDFSEIIGEVNIKVPYVSLYVDSTINVREVPLSGQSPSNAIIKIYDSSYYLGQVVAGNNGLWKTNVVLPDRGNRATHYLRAETTNSKSGATVYSEIKPVYYDPNQPRIMKIEFGQTGVFKKEVKRGSTFRYLWDREKDHELDVTFDDVSRIEEFVVHSGNGAIVAERDQVTYNLLENKVSAVWKTPVITDEIRISYRIKKAPVKYPEDYTELTEDVLRSGLPALWRDATVLSATTTYNEEKQAFESNSIVVLSDGYTALNTTLEISDYDGAEILPEDSGLPIKLLRKNVIEGERADVFEFDFIIDRDVILKQVESMEKQSRMSIQAGKGVVVAAKSAIQFVKMKGTLGAVSGGNKLYEIYDNFMTGFDYGKQSDDLNRLRATVEGPCFEPMMREYYRTEILKAEIDLKFSTGYKIISSIAMSIAGKVVPAGWIAEGVSIGTSVTGSIAGSMMDEVTETTYKDLKGYIDQWTFLTCRRSKGDPSDSGSDGKKGNGSNGGGIGNPVPVGLIDPSGYLYEGVEDNRLEGVKATALEQIDGEWVFWDAEWFAQENPLITDIEGRYQWDVPEGLWQVIYEKEGYEIAFSDALPVPPPQLEVNIGMTSLASPTVEISAEHGGIVKLVFNQYMDLATIEHSTFKVFDKELDEFGNKISISGTITPVDAKENPKDRTSQLARIFKFTPAISLETGATYSVWVSDMVRDYAEKTMDAAVVRDVTIPEKPYVPPVDTGTGGSENIKKEVPQVPKLKLQTIEYPINPEEDVQALVVYKKDAQGNLIMVKASVYDPITKTMKFIAEEGASYVVGYNPVQFDDIDMWAKDDIAYLASRGIIEGVGDGKFDPQRSVTRAEFLKLLVSTCDNVNLDQYTKSNFNDVKTEDWYWKVIAWASENQVVSGYGDGSFRPTDTITREQMAMMLSNFIKAIGLELDGKNAKINFNDAGMIGTWAQDAINEMQKSGVINGKDGGIFDPKGNTTRAEAAKVVAEILKRFI